MSMKSMNDLFLIEDETDKAVKTMALITTNKKEWSLPIWIPKTIIDREKFVIRQANKILGRYSRCNGITVSCGPVFIGR